MYRLFATILLLPTLLLAQTTKTLPLTRFGDVTLHIPTSNHPEDLTIIFAPTENESPIPDLTKEALRRNEATAIISTPSYISSLKSETPNCYGIAGELERLSQLLQKQVGIDTVIKPRLFGVGPDGGGIVYLALASASKSFSAGYSYQFDPHLPVPSIECDGDTPEPAQVKNKIVSLIPTDEVTSPWFMFPSAQCTNECKSSFSATVPKLKIVEQFSVKEFLDIGEKTSDTDTSSAFTVVTSEASHPTKVLFFFSGDGGWANLVESVSDNLNDAGVTVIGINALRYFWKKKTPDELASDFNTLFKDNLKLIDNNPVFIGGYSFGADIAPFIIPRLSEELKGKVKGVILLNPGLFTDFEVNLTDWLPISSADSGLSIIDEIQRVKDDPILCLYGEEEEESACKGSYRIPITSKALPGSHHFNDDYARLSQEMVRFMEHVN